MKVHLGFCVDADNRVTRADLLGNVFQRLIATRSQVVNSRPRKDTEVAPACLSLLERLIVIASRTASDYRTAISGQRYLMRTSALDGIYMPVGLPAEDGFLRAMLLTRLLTEEEGLARIHGEPELWHVYESLRSGSVLLRHLTRLVIGAAVNTAVFERLRSAGRDFSDRSDLLRTAAQNERWLPGVVRGAVPRWTFGFVPVHFLVKCLQNLLRPRARSVGRVTVGGVGFAFDALVVNAPVQMARESGAGYS